ncbi:MAG TPA: tetratricopeptide repeat protein, partial [Acidimicrobiales bacterium]
MTSKPEASPGPFRAEDGTVTLLRPGALSAPQHNLPALLSSFIGREGEGAEIAKLLSGNRLVTLVGAPGVGKTRLSIEVASEVLSQYPDGVWLVELAPIAEPLAVPHAVASVLAISEKGGADPVEMLVAGLRYKHLLLVLDNCEHLLGDCARLADRLLRTCRQLVVLATSREPLGLNGEWVRRIGGLSTPRAAEPFETVAANDAVRLFVERGTATRADFALEQGNAPLVGELCRRLQGVPLAIELAAARLEMLSVPEILMCLSGPEAEFDVLDGPTHPEPAHHRTLGAALDWSYRLLTPAEAALLRRMSIFAGGCSIEGIKAVCTGGEVADARVVETLGALVRKSLVSAETGGSHTRYHLLDTVRAYSARKLQEAGEDTSVSTAHCAWAVELAERGEGMLGISTHAELATSLSAEQENLRAAFEWALGQGQTDPPLRLAVALVAFWWPRGRQREGREWLERAMSSASDPDAGLWAKALWGMAFLTESAGNVDEAVPLAEQSLVVSVDCDDASVPGRARNLLGLLSMLRAPNDAIPLLEENVALARETGKPRLLRSSLATLAKSHLLIGDAETAQVCLRECRAISVAIDDGNAPSEILSLLGQAALAEGDYASAQSALDDALIAARAVDQRPDEAAALSWLGELARGRGRYEEAQHLLDRGLTIARETRQAFTAARCLCFLARVARDRGDLAGALARFTDALAMARSARLTYLVARCQIGLGEVAHAMGDAGEARRWLEEALTVARLHADRPAVAGAWYAQADLAWAKGSLERARTLCQQALALQDEVRDLPGLAASLEMAASLRGDRGSGTRLFGAAQGLRDGGGYARAPLTSDRYEADLRAARHALGSKQFKVAWDQGYALTVSEAVAYASRGRGLRRRSSKGWRSL